jgi:ribosomal protein S3AE
MKKIINGEVFEMTDEEISLHNIAKEENKNFDDKIKAVRANKESAITKFIGLGLTADECKALFKVTKAKE